MVKHNLKLHGSRTITNLELNAAKKAEDANKEKDYAVYLTVWQLAIVFFFCVV